MKVLNVSFESDEKDLSKYGTSETYAEAMWKKATSVTSKTESCLEENFLKRITYLQEQKVWLHEIRILYTGKYYDKKVITFSYPLYYDETDKPKFIEDAKAFWNKYKSTKETD